MIGTSRCGAAKAIWSFSVNVIGILLISNPLAFRASTARQVKGEKARLRSFLLVQSSLESASPS